MYGIVTGPLPVTGANMLAFALTSGALMIGGVVMLRLVYFGRKRKAARVSTVPADQPAADPT